MLRDVAALGLLLVTACTTTSGGPLPARLVDVPGSREGLDRKSWRARQLFEAGRDRQALDLIDEILVESPEHTDAHRVRQDILRRRGRIGLLKRESEVRLEARPDSAQANYLGGRVARTDDEKLELFDNATRLAPESFWGWLGTAYVLRVRDPERSLDIYRRLYDLSNRHPTAAIALAAALRGADLRRVEGEDGSRYLSEALSVYAELRSDPLVPGVGDLGIAETYYQRDKAKEAWPALMMALQQRPYDPGVRGMVLQLVERGLPRDQVDQIVDALQQDTKRLHEFGLDEGAGVLARVFSAAGMPFAARAALETTDGNGPRGPQLRRTWLELLLRTGDVSTYLESVRRGYPTSLLADERNRVRGRWVQLFSGPWMTAPDPLEDLGMATGLTDALIRTGLLEAADTVATIAALRHAEVEDQTRLSELHQEARREIAFERALRRVLYRGYGRLGELDLDGVLDQLRRISLETLDEDVVGEPERFHVPMVGDLLDPFGAGLCEHLASYNHYLVLGQRNGQPVEGMLLTQLAVREFEQVRELPLEGPTLEVVGENRMIRSLTGVYGGDLAGVALVNHYVVDMDSVRDWANEIRERREIIRQDGGALLSDPLPEHAVTLDPASVQWRLSMLSPVGDAELEEAVLDMIRWHERGHLVDSFYYLPVESNVWRVLGLLFQHGFSKESIEGEMEGRAEVAALALSPYTRLVLAHIAVFLDAPIAGSPHVTGFRRVARRISRQLEEQGLPSEVSRWHLVDPVVFRKIGQDMLRELW